MDETRLTVRQRYWLNYLDPHMQQRVFEVLHWQKGRVSRDEKALILKLDRLGWLRHEIAELLERHTATVGRYVNGERHRRYMRSEAGKHESR